MPTPLDFTIIEHLFPTYLTTTEKGRLLHALEQFKEVNDKSKWNSKLYTHFYASSQYNYFLQGDLLQEIRYPDFNKTDRSFERTYTDALILSNTCDLDVSNLRKIAKQVVFAPLLEMEQYLEAATNQKHLDETIQGIKTQAISNILYLPPNPYNGKEYICHLDKAFWFPTDELNSYLSDMEQTRIASLDYFGYYLFLVKPSYHFCRLPEEKQR